WGWFPPSWSCPALSPCSPPNPQKRRRAPQCPPRAGANLSHRKKSDWPSAAAVSAGDPCREKFRWVGGAKCCPACRPRPPPLPPAINRLEGSNASVPHFLDVLAAGGLQQLARLGIGIFRVARFHHNKKSVMGGLGKAFAFEERMIQPGQAIQKQHAEERTERAQQKRALIRNRERIDRAE